MTPQEIESFAFGFDLTSANYSGGAGGTFTNIVSGQEAWTVNGATPSFETRSGLEGMIFNNLATEAIQGEMRCLYEATIVATAQPDIAGNYYIFGSSLAANFAWGLGAVAASCRAFKPLGVSSASAPITNPGIYTASFSPFNNTCYSQFNDGTPATFVHTLSKSAAIDYPDASIGLHRNLYFDGWIARVLVFSRALHYEDNTSLQALINTEMENIGL